MWLSWRGLSEPWFGGSESWILEHPPTSGDWWNFVLRCYYLIAGGVQLKNPRHQLPSCGGWMLRLGSSFQLGRLSHSHKYSSNQCISQAHHSMHSGYCSTSIPIYWLYQLPGFRQLFFVNCTLHLCLPHHLDTYLHVVFRWMGFFNLYMRRVCVFQQDFSCLWALVKLYKNNILQYYFHPVSWQLNALVDYLPANTGHLII